GDERQTALHPKITPCQTHPCQRKCNPPFLILLTDNILNLSFLFPIPVRRFFTLWRKTPYLAV
ncbi:MAG TPA: hypothetical protein VK205_07370, partial [Prolixibacteraceae bacterium]|nr:hypothetical protein [Prolixibacteraceae bacterium]